jgi:uncharacterized membrane protein
MEKTANYTDEMVARIKAMYAEVGNAGIQSIADAVGKSVPSVRAKLIHEKVWVPAEKVAKTPKREGPSKKQVLAGIAIVEPSLEAHLEGLDGATIPALSAVFQLLTANRRAREAAVTEESVAA